MRVWSHPLIFLLFYALNMSGLRAQSVVITERDSEVVLDRQYLQFHEDSTQTLELDAIQKLPLGLFFQVNRTVPVFGATRSAYWARFSITNPTDQTLHRILVIGYALLDSIRLYVPTAHGYELLETGNRVSARNHEIDYRNPTLEFSIPPGTHVYYLRIQNEGLNQFPLKLWEAKAFENMRFKETYALSFLFGLIAVMAVYNFFIGYVTKNSNYFLYVSYITCTLIYSFATQGHCHVFLSVDVARWLTKQGIILFVGGMIAFSGLFAVSFLNLKTYARPLYWLVLIASSSSLLAGVTSLFDYVLGLAILIKGVSVTAVAVMLSSYYCCFRRYRPAYYFTFAWTVFAVGSFLSSMSVAGLLPAHPITSWGYFYGTSFEVVMLSLALGDRVRYNQQKSEQEIRRLNESLELKVEEKTRDIRSILGHIRLGIFTIASEELLIAPEYSRHLHEILHESRLAGKRAISVLFRYSALTGDQISAMESALVASLQADALFFAANQESLVQEVALEFADGVRKIIEIDWQPMINSQDVTEKILVVCKDVTELRTIRAEMQTQQKDLKYIGEIIAHSADAIARFFASTQKLIEENKRLILKNQSAEPSVLKILFINMHSLKGMARSMGFADLCDISHRIEQALANIQQKKVPWIQDHLLAELYAAESTVENYARINREKLGREDGQNALISIPKKNLLSEFERMETIDLSAPKMEVESHLRFLINCAVHRLFHLLPNLLGEVMGVIPRLARDLGKDVPEIIIESEEFLVRDEAAEVLRNVFVHILRNAMDHGIESAEERLAQKKRAQAIIRCTVQDSEKGLEIVVADDGRGLALKNIREIALVRGFIQAWSPMRAADIAELIFIPGFTTTRTLTDISGRGVGMDAIREYLKRVHATVELRLDDPVQAEQGDFAGFSTHILLPKNLYRRGWMEDKRGAQTLNISA